MLRGRRWIYYELRSFEMGCVSRCSFNWKKGCYIRKEKKKENIRRALIIKI